MTTWDDIAMDEAMSEMNGIIDSDMEFEEIQEELFERGFVEHYDDAATLIIKRHNFLQSLQENENTPPKKHADKEVDELKFEDIFS